MGPGGRCCWRLSISPPATASGPFFLEVRASNTPAQALYKAAGFREAGLRKNYYQNPAEDGLIMRADVGAGDRKEHP